MTAGMVMVGAVGKVAGMVVGIVVVVGGAVGSGMGGLGVRGHLAKGPPHGSVGWSVKKASQPYTLFEEMSVSMQLRMETGENVSCCVKVRRSQLD